MPHDRMLATRNTYTWINKYIFPGGFLPSVKVIDEITRRHTGLRMVDGLSMGASYAETLRLWDRTFLAASEQVLDLGFDEIFLRMWHFYLEYSRAGFASGYIDVNQLTFVSRARRHDASSSSPSLAGLVAVAVGMGAAAVRASQLDKAAVVDVAWGAGFVLVAVAAAVVGTALDEGTGWRRWLVLGLVAVWGLRLAWHIRGRAVGEHGGQEDPRYAEMLGGPPSQVGMAHRGAPGLPRAGRRPVVRRRAGDGRRGAGRRVVAGRRRRRGRLGRPGCSSRPSATASSRRTRPSRRRPGRRSWTRGSGATPAIPTTSATPASGGASGWSPASAPAGWPGWRPCSARPP